jgi:hypothetical protein
MNAPAVLTSNTAAITLIKESSAPYLPNTSKVVDMRKTTTAT